MGHDTRAAVSLQRWIATGLAWVACLLGAAPAQAALRADQLLLITNKNVPGGGKLAHFYAEKRNVPGGRILELDLPTSEEISFDTYERQVVPPVREYLRANGLEHAVTCLVTFYGVPFRIGNRVNTPQEKAELAAAQDELAKLPARLEPMVVELERVTVEVNRPFRPQSGKDLDALERRVQAARADLAAHLTPEVQAKLRDRLDAAFTPLIGPRGVLDRDLARRAAQPGTMPATAADTVNGALRFRATLQRLQQERYEPAAREELRKLVRENLGPVDLAQLLKNQVGYLVPENTGAAVDSELSLLWWEYPRAMWVTNPLHYRFPNPPATPVLMVTRLDGPQSGTAGEIIVASLKAEAEGLKGRLVIDSRGLPVVDKDGKPNPMGQWDQTLRDLADVVQAKAKISMTFDDREEVLAAHSVRDVGVYIGWYSVAKYVPACSFTTGAFGFHLASYTMTTLRREDPAGWVRNLLNDGCAASIGAVAEPYLQSFPPGDELIELLLTGKLTLAEVYWKTVPWTSWQLTIIGDPLYTPFKVNPPLKVEDLPPKLQLIFAHPATRP